MSSERGGSCSGVMGFFFPFPQPSTMDEQTNEGRWRIERVRLVEGRMRLKTKTEWCRQFASGKSQPSAVPDKNLKRLSLLMV